ncbi:MAG: hypothetical protein WA902_09510 [Thermosynechococcaceae cyanobacterium]
MFFILSSFPSNSLTSPPALLASVDIQQRNNWQFLLEGIYDSQLKFEIKWVEISKRGNGYFRQSYSIDKPPPPPPKPSLGAELILKPNETRDLFDFFDYDYSLRVFILNSSKIYWLSNTNDPKVLDALVQLLDIPDRAWAANVVLAKMMGNTGLGFEVRESKANQWWEAEGKTGKAKQEWAAYLEKVKPTMKWSVLGGYYKHITPSGETVP